MNEITRNCPKCGGFTSIKYDNAIDKIHTSCDVCGFTWNQSPLAEDLLTPTTQEGEK